MRIAILNLTDINIAEVLFHVLQRIKVKLVEQMFRHTDREYLAMSNPDFPLKFDQNSIDVPDDGSCITCGEPIGAEGKYEGVSLHISAWLEQDGVIVSGTPRDLDVMVDLAIAWRRSHVSTLKHPRIEHDDFEKVVVIARARNIIRINAGSFDHMKSFLLHSLRTLEHMATSVKESAESFETTTAPDRRGEEEEEEEEEEENDKEHGIGTIL